MKLQISNLLTGLELYYKMDGSLGYAKDYSSYGRDASIFGYITQDSSGLIDTGFQFDACINTQLRIPSFAFKNTNKLSFNFWCIPDSSTTIQMFIGDANQNNVNGYILIYKQGSNIYYQFCTGTRIIVHSFNFFTDYTNWVMCTITADYDSKIISFYKNGVLVSKQTTRYNMKFPDTNRIKYIGSYSVGYIYPFKGNLDEFGVWNRILSPFDIQQLYNNGIGKSHPFIGAINRGPSLKIDNETVPELKMANLHTGLQSYYKMDGSLGYAKDYSPYSRDASIFGLITQDSSGIINSGFYFDASGYIQQPAYISLGNQLTFNWWMNSSYDLALRTIYNDRPQSNTTPYIWIRYIGKYIYFQYTDGISYKTINMFNIYNTDNMDKWIMITITVDFNSKIIKGYLNGSHYVTSPQEFNMLKPNTLTTKFIGTYQGRLHTNAYTYFGYLDEFAIWNRVLSPDEISQLYNNGLGKSYPFK